MRNKIKRIFSIIICLTMLFLVYEVNSQQKVYAKDTATISIDSETCTIGDDVSVNISVSGSSEIYMCDIWINYDSNVLKPVSGYSGGGGGSIRILATEETSFNLTFKAVSTGNSELSVNKSNSIVSSETDDYMTIGSKNGSVKVTGSAESTNTSTDSSSEPTTNSSIKSSSKTENSDNNDLSSLSVLQGNISPAFSASVTDYTLNVDSDCSKITINADADDNLAKVSIDGTIINSDNSTATVKVTAQNGKEKIYTIHVIRKTVNQQETKTETQKETATEKNNITQTNKETVTISNKSTKNENQNINNDQSNTSLKDSSKECIKFGNISVDQNQLKNICVIMAVVLIVFFIIIIILLIRILILKKRLRKLGDDTADIFYDDELSDADAYDDEDELSNIDIYNENELKDLKDSNKSKAADTYEKDKTIDADAYDKEKLGVVKSYKETEKLNKDPNKDAQKNNTLDEDLMEYTGDAIEEAIADIDREEDELVESISKSVMNNSEIEEIEMIEINLDEDTQDK